MIDISSIKTPDAYEAAFGRIVPKKAKPPITIVCEMCGDTATVLRDGKRYCSARCRAAAHDAFKDPRLSRLNTVAELAAFMNCSPSTIRNRVRSGGLQAHRVGNMLLVVRPLGVRTADAATISPSIARKFEVFADNLGLSVRDFANAAGLSKTTAHRLLSGTFLARNFAKHKSLIELSLIRFLVDRGKRINAAEAVVASLLTN